MDDFVSECEYIENTYFIPVFDCLQSWGDLETEIQ